MSFGFNGLIQNVHVHMCMSLSQLMFIVWPFILSPVFCNALLINVYRWFPSVVLLHIDL
jgi:hypothetical protein